MPVDESVSAGSGSASMNVLSRFLAYGGSQLRGRFGGGRRGVSMAERGVGGLAGECEGGREEGDDMTGTVAERTGGPASHDARPNPGPAYPTRSWNGGSSLAMA